MSRINKLRQMATKCIRKIPTVSVKSNYNVEGNLSITGKLLVNGEDFSKNIISSINGKTGDVRLVAGEGINLDLSKNSEIIIDGISQPNKAKALPQKEAWSRAFGINFVAEGSEE